MLGFPPSTEFNKRIPKQKFYENAAVPAAVKRLFADQLHCRRAGDRDRDFRAVSDRTKTG